MDLGQEELRLKAGAYHPASLSSARGVIDIAPAFRSQTRPKNQSKPFKLGQITLEQWRKTTGVFKHIAGSRQEWIDTPINQLRQLYIQITKSNHYHGPRRSLNDDRSDVEASLVPHSCFPSTASSADIQTRCSSPGDGDQAGPYVSDIATHGAAKEHAGYNHYSARSGLATNTVTTGSRLPTGQDGSLSRKSSATSSKRTSSSHIYNNNSLAKLPQPRRVICVLHRSQGGCEVCRSADGEPSKFRSASAMFGHIMKSGVVCRICRKVAQCQKDVCDHEGHLLEPEPMLEPHQWPYGICPDERTLRRLIGQEEHPSSYCHDWEVCTKLGQRWINSWCWLMEHYLANNYLASRNLAIPWPYYREPERRRERLPWAYYQQSRPAGQTGTLYQPYGSPRPAPSIDESVASASSRSQAQFSNDGSSIPHPRARRDTSGTLPTLLSSPGPAYPRAYSAGASIDGGTGQHRRQGQPSLEDALPIEIGKQPTVQDDIAFMGGDMTQDGRAPLTSSPSTHVKDLDQRCPEHMTLTAGLTADAVPDTISNLKAHYEYALMELDRVNKENESLKERNRMLEERYAALKSADAALFDSSFDASAYASDNI